MKFITMQFKQTLKLFGHIVKKLIKSLTPFKTFKIRRVEI